MSRCANVDILEYLNLRSRKYMARKRSDRYVIVMVLLAVSALSLSPAIAEQIQSQVGTVIFHLTGQATSLNATLGSLGAATLDLIGGIRGDGEGGSVLGNLTGRLQIVSVNYTVSDGSGSSNRLGEFALYGRSSAGELVLHGLIQNNSTVTVDAPPSRLSSIAYLALSGTMTMNRSIGSGLIVGLNQNVTSTNVGMNSTTVTKYEHPSSSSGNFTSQTETTTENATLNPSNSTTVSYALPGQNNTTITLTRLNNQSVTVLVTGTVANSTITQTTTTTVAETTITQISSAPAAYNTTVIVTNSTQSAP